MKITKILNYSKAYGIYVFPMSFNTKKFKTDFWGLCDDFVKTYLDVELLPEVIKVIASDKPFKNSEIVILTVTDDITWNWANPRLKRKDDTGGMYKATQQIVGKFMKDKDFPFILYVKIEKID